MKAKFLDTVPKTQNCIFDGKPKPTPIPNDFYYEYKDFVGKRVHLSYSKNEILQSLFTPIKSVIGEVKSMCYKLIKTLDKEPVALKINCEVCSYVISEKGVELVVRISKCEIED